MKDWRIPIFGTIAFALTSTAVMLCIALLFGHFHSMRQAVYNAPAFITLEVLLSLLLLVLLCRRHYLEEAQTAKYFLSLSVAFFAASRISLASFHPMPRFGNKPLFDALFYDFVFVTLNHLFAFGAIASIPLSTLLVWICIRKLGN